MGNIIYLLSDIAVVSNHLILQTEMKKLSKYKDFEIETFKTLSMKVKTIAEIIRALDMINNRMNKNVEAITRSSTLLTIRRNSPVRISSHPTQDTINSIIQSKQNNSRIQRIFFIANIK